jgi:PTH1 family peptidyl-tRNA hydrolase
VKIMVGLGNPGREYAATRHNLGFMVIDQVAKGLEAGTMRRRFHAELQEAIVDGEKIVFVKPQTYMNLSGSSAREVANWYKVSPDQILVITDDIELPFATIRMRARGSSGGHNGLKSIFAALGTQDVPRLRIGVGRGGGDAVRRVLTRFSEEEAEELPRVIQSASECALTWLREGIVVAMNRCNRRREPDTDPAVATVTPEQVGAGK